MSCIKQIFVDLDGPLLDSKERHYFCYRTILKRLGVEPIGIDEYWKMKRARCNRKELLSMSGAEKVYDAFLAGWLELIESPDALQLDKLQEGAIECLSSWKRQGVKTILVTMRKNAQALDKQLRELSLRPFLEAVLVCDHSAGGTGKADAVLKAYPDRKIAKDAVWIGDTEVDWEAAKVLGCDVVLVSNGLRSNEYLVTLEGAILRQSIATLKDIEAVETNVR